MNIEIDNFIKKFRDMDNNDEDFISYVKKNKNIQTMWENCENPHSMIFIIRMANKGNKFDKIIMMNLEIIKMMKNFIPKMGFKIIDSFDKNFPSYDDLKKYSKIISNDLLRYRPCVEGHTEYNKSIFFIKIINFIIFNIVAFIISKFNNFKINSFLFRLMSKNHGHTIYGAYEQVKYFIISAIYGDKCVYHENISYGVLYTMYMVDICSNKFVEFEEYKKSKAFIERNKQISNIVRKHFPKCPI